MAFHVTADGDILTATSDDPKHFLSKWIWDGGETLNFSSGNTVRVSGPFSELGDKPSEFTAEAFAEFLDRITADLE